MSVTPHSSTAQSGFTLIEILVAVLVLSIGLLGLAGLQATALRNNTSASERSQATFLAYDIIDRMRANPSAFDAGNYDNAYGTAPTGATNCQTTVASCTAAQMAAFDLDQWKCLLGNWTSDATCNTTLDIDRGLLPDGDGRIVRDAGDPDVVTVTVRWTDGRSSETVELDVRTEL